MMKNSMELTEIDAAARGEAFRTCEPEPFWRASSTLLSRLAEAVDGNRMGSPVVYVAEYTYKPNQRGHEVHGPFPGCDEARAFRANKLNDGEGLNYGIFGPFWTRRDPLRTRPSTSAAQAVEKVVVHLTGGRTIELNPDDADALFWSTAAVEKFVVPYYVGIGTVQEGMTIMRDVERGVVLVHRPGSEWRTESALLRVDGKPLDMDPGIGSVVVVLDSASEDPREGGAAAYPLM